MNTNGGFRINASVLKFPQFAVWMIMRKRWYTTEMRTDCLSVFENRFYDSGSDRDENLNCHRGSWTKFLASVESHYNSIWQLSLVKQAGTANTLIHVLYINSDIEITPTDRVYSAEFSFSEVRDRKIAFDHFSFLKWLWMVLLCVLTSSSTTTTIRLPPWCFSTTWSPQSYPS